MDPEIIIKSSALDFNLAELLGEKPADFLGLYFNGELFEPFGTPWDSPSRRETWADFVDALNVRTKDSLWPSMWQIWSAALKKQFGLENLSGLPDEDRPVASWKVTRVCHGYSEHLHCAVGLFDRLKDGIRSWSIGKCDDGTMRCQIVSASGEEYIEFGNGRTMAQLIGIAVMRLLLAEGLPTPVPAQP